MSSKRVVIIGATGKVGGFTARECERQGHHVTAFGRSRRKLNSLDADRVVVGDARNPSDITDALVEQDAAILTFGAPLNRQTILKGTDLCETVTSLIIRTMKQNKQARLIAMTSIGAGDSAGQGRFIFRKVIRPIILGRIMKDRTAQENLIRQSGLDDWVIIRPAELTDGPLSTEVGIFLPQDRAPQPRFISRQSVAGFLASAVDSTTFDMSAAVIAQAKR